MYLSGSPAQLTPEERMIVKQFSRKRIYLFFYVIILVAFAMAIGEFSDAPIFAVDDIAKVVLSIVMVVIIAVTWGRQTLQSLKRINTISLVVGVVLLAFSVFAVVVEMSNPGDVGDDFPAIILSIFLIINGVA